MEGRANIDYTTIAQAIQTAAKESLRTKTTTQRKAQEDLWTQETKNIYEARGISIKRQYWKLAEVLNNTHMNSKKRHK